MFGLSPSADALLRGGLLTIALVLWTILLIRAIGLRSLSKMTAFDFVATVATGSLIAQAGSVSTLPQFLQILAAVTAVFGLQWALARSRHASKRVGEILQNDPVLLMRHGEFLDDALAATKVTREEVVEKLRKANVHSLSSVRAVVLETTGDMSVLHGEVVEPALLDGVRRGAG